MKMTPELRTLKNAYMKASAKKDTAEMARLKAKAMTVKNNQETAGAKNSQVATNSTETALIEKLELLGEKETKVSTNPDGDSFELSSAGQALGVSQKSKDD